MSNLKATSFKKNELLKTKIIILVITLFSVVELPAQDTLKHHNRYPAGISIKYGIGSYSVKDEFTSKERYSGNLPYFSLGWAREHNKYVYHLDMVYRNSNNIKNHNVTSKLTQFMLNQGFLYPLKKKSLFKRDIYLWLGPSTEFFIYYNKPDIAYTGINYSQSFAALFSLGFNADFIYPLSNKFQLESSIHLTVLSLGIRMIDFDESDQSFVKPLSLFSGLNSSFNLGARYNIFQHVSVKCSYKFEYTRISEWDPLLSASDNVVIGLTYRF